MAVFRSSVMVGRDQELDRLRRVVAAVNRAEPAFVVIEGEPGVGKTRLAEELTSTLGSALLLTGHGMALPSGELPFGVMSEVLRDLVRTVGATAIRSLLADETHALAGLLPALAEGGAGVGRVDRVAVFGATAELLQRLADDRLVVVFVDDLQWVDDESLDVFEYVGRVAHDCRLMLLTTVRIGDGPEDRFAGRSAELHRLPRREVVTLGRLSGAEVAEQVRNLLGPGVDDATVQQICHLSDGVPFFAEELAASGMADEPGLPPSVRRLVLARLPELGADARAVLDATTVGEAHCEHRLLARVTEMAPARFQAATAEAIGAGVLELTEDGRIYRFRHALLRGTLEQELHPSRRIHWHQKWARTLAETHAPLSAAEAAIAVAQHWHAAGDPEETLTSGIAAARASARLAAPRQEAEFWQRAFALWPDDREDVDGVSKGEAAVRLMNAREVASQFGEALDWFQATLDAGVDDDALELCLQINVQYFSNLLGTPVRPFVTTDTVGDLIEQLASAGCSWPAMDAIESLWHLFPESHAQLFDRVDGLLDEMSHELGDDEAVCVVLYQRAWFALENGRADEALRHLEDEMRLARAISPQYLYYAEADVMCVLLAQGRATEVIDVGTAALAVAAPEAAPHLWSRLALLQGRALLALGRHDEVRDLLDRARHSTVPDLLDGFNLGPLQMRLDARLGNLPAATRILESFAAVSGSARSEAMIWSLSWHWFGYPDLAFASGDLSLLDALRPVLGEPWLVRQSDWSCELVLNALRAVACPLRGYPGPADQALELAEVCDRLHRHGDLGRAWSLEVVALRGRAAGTDSSNDWAAAVEAWTQIGYRFDEAVCRLRLGEALLRDGHRERAAEQLADALSFAHALDAKPLISAIRHTARLARVRLAGDTSTSRNGSAPLTERETEVLALVARGHTDVQIAEVLSISPKTASVHVSRIIAKLGAANRTEATALGRNLGLIE
jgi:DNA-binding CsgD family transcriptional regulator/tetratricopeptide (TPR) repeat protein